MRDIESVNISTGEQKLTAMPCLLHCQHGNIQGCSAYTKCQCLTETKFSTELYRKRDNLAA